MIRLDLTVTEEFLPLEAAKEQFNLSKLPDDAGDTIRIVRIGDYDACPCIGPHVRSTREVGEFRIVSTTYENGLLRIRFRLATPGSTETKPNSYLSST